MQTETAIFAIVILIFSVIIHEVAHGFMALKLGDPTAKNAGRLTLNPLPHIDPMGSIILPVMLALLPGAFIIGWAKPVPYNPYNLSNKKWGDTLVSVAGPLSNIVVAVVFGLLLRAAFVLGFATETLVNAVSIIVLVNLILAFFNLLPIPPLDGSKVLSAILPWHARMKYMQFQNLISQYGIVAMIGFIFILVYFLWPVFQALISLVFTVLTGISGFGI